MSFPRSRESIRSASKNILQTMEKYYFVYILASKAYGTLYIGMTNNLLRRVYEHKNKLIEGFTKKYEVDKLVYYEESTSVHAAISREKQLKKWNRQWKINLIESFNPTWKDLYWDMVGGRQSEKDFIPNGSPPSRG